MKQKTIDAIKAVLAAAGEEDYDMVCKDVEVTVDVLCCGEDESGPFSFIKESVNIHKLENNRWIIAHWDDKKHQWQSSDFSAEFSRANRQACYCFARKLEALAGNIKTYRSAPEAVRAALKN